MIKIVGTASDSRRVAGRAWFGAVSYELAKAPRVEVLEHLLRPLEEQLDSLDACCLVFGIVGTKPYQLHPQKTNEARSIRFTLDFEFPYLLTLREHFPDIQEKQINRP
ncbi:MAG TPA: hypothetical protein DCZ47_02650 [Candidatus Magasanikbacteria bacterium]|nr:hypothetical protein [Candidatus Magasanikbacteria bacterium]